MEKTLFLDLPSSVLNLWHTINDEFETRLVGGAVRDMVLGLKPKDYDFCTTATPDQMVAFAILNGYRIEPTGLQHGTVSFILDGEAYEFTTLRIDTDCDGRHATVQFTTDFKADAARRDFTINAMSADIRGRVHDYFNGLEHLTSGDHVGIVFVGDPKDRIREDFLRIMRFFRFAARFDAGMDWEAIKFMCSDEAHNGLRRVSRERIWAEMAKIAVSDPDARERVMTQMTLTGVAKAINLFPNRLTQSCVKFANDPAVFMAGFCDEVDPDSFARMWKMSGDERIKMLHVFKASPNWGTREMVSDMLDGVRLDLTQARASVFLPGMTPDEVKMINDVVPTFTVTGKDLLEEGFAPGPEMGKELARRKAVWKQEQMKGL